MKIYKHVFNSSELAKEDAKKQAEKEDYQSANVIEDNGKYIVYAPANNLEALRKKEVARF